MQKQEVRKKSALAKSKKCMIHALGISLCCGGVH